MKYYLIVYCIKAEKIKIGHVPNDVLNKKCLNFQIILRVPKSIIILRDILEDRTFSNLSRTLINLMNNQ
jgi:hypothetical protein